MNADGGDDLKGELIKEATDVQDVSIEGEPDQGQSELGEGSTKDLNKIDGDGGGALVVEKEEKETFGSKFAYILILVGYAVGFGNIWRFPYLMQKNGGVVFLIPYALCLAFLGIPIFFLELAIGQRLRKSSIKAWLEISKYLVGVGIASMYACIILGYYYNTLIAWCFYYFFSSFQKLPWTDCREAEPSCETKENDTECMECKRIKAPSHFWYNNVLRISSGLTDPGSFNPIICGCLALSWFLTWAILVKGVKASGKVAYFTSLFPYFVLAIFFVQGLNLDGMENGFSVVFTPDWSKLLSAEVWFQAGTQIFFSLGLGFGILISFSALNPANNNCYKDAIMVALINCGTSLFAASVVFPTLGYKGTKEFNSCVTDLNHTYYSVKNSNIFHNFLKKSKNVTLEFKASSNRTNITCDLMEFVTKSASGTGLIFIAYAEAIISFPAPSFWAILFFSMIVTLGVDSGFTTVEGAVIAIHDLNFFNLNVKKWKITTAVCLTLWALSFLFCFGWAEYMLTFIDEFTVNWILITVGFFECIGVAWVYGLRQFSYDIQLMTGHKPNVYMLLCWKFISPFLMLVLFCAIWIDYFTKKDSLTYSVYSHEKGTTVATRWPTPALIAGFIILFLALGSIPLFAALAYFKIYPVKDNDDEGDFPEEELRIERHLTDFEGNGRDTGLQRVLYWGSSHDLRRSSAASASARSIEMNAHQVLDLSENNPELPVSDSHSSLKLEKTLV